MKSQHFVGGKGMRTYRLFFVLFALSFVLFCSKNQDDSQAHVKKIQSGQNITIPAEVVVTASGLKYVDIEQGTGAMPQAGQTVVVHYTGWLLNGKKFDSSLDRHQPFKFVLGQGQVIPGWDEGIKTMHVGGKRRLFIPYQLAYGERGYPPVIPPKAMLVFDVQLLRIE